MRIRIRHLVRVATAVFCLGLALLSFEVALVPTVSMERTVLVGDNVLVFKLLDAPRIPWSHLRLPRLHSVHRGELVSFLAPDHSNMVFLKRVVAIAGDTVEMRNGTLFVNGVCVVESYAPRSNRVPMVAPLRIRTGDIFVLGDNRDLSEDSRDFGPVPVDTVIGRPVAVVWSTRARTGDLLDTRGNIRLAYYWTVLLHPVASTRWSRIGRLL